MDSPPKSPLPEMIRVEDSSTIHSIGWDATFLFVGFNSGQVFRYKSVPPKLWDLLKSAVKSDVSMGSLFHWTIKIHPDKYPGTKLAE